MNVQKQISTFFYYAVTYWYHKFIFGAYGYKSRINNLLKVEYPSRIFIGSNVKIGKFAWLAANSLTESKHTQLFIGDGSQIGNFCHIYATSKIRFGKSVLIADKVYISDNSHMYTNVNLPICMQPIMQLKEILIDDGAWLGENVCIIGANVGKGSVVGANSVVTKDIPDYCLAVGSPAKIIKRFCSEKNEWIKVS